MVRKAWKIVRKTDHNYYFLLNGSYRYPLLILTALEKRQISILAQKGYRNHLYARSKYLLKLPKIYSKTVFPCVLSSSISAGGKCVFWLMEVFRFEEADRGISKF